MYELAEKFKELRVISQEYFYNYVKKKKLTESLTLKNKNIIYYLYSQTILFFILLPVLTILWRSLFIFAYDATSNILILLISRNALSGWLLSLGIGFIPEKLEKLTKVLKILMKCPFFLVHPRIYSNLFVSRPGFPESGCYIYG